MKEKYLKQILNLDHDSLLFEYLNKNFHEFTLAGYIDFLAERDGNVLAIHHLDSDGKKEELTYKDLSEKANQMANYLKNKGVKKNDVVALVLRNNIEFFIACLAIQKLGAVCLPLFYSNKEEQYKSLFERAKPKCVIANDYEIKQSVDNSCFVLNELDKVLDKKTIRLCTNPKSAYSNNWANISEYKKESKSFKNQKVRITDLGYLFSTSGTTGKPKLVMHNYGFSLAHYYTGLWYGVKKGQKHLTVSDSGWAMSSWSMAAVLLHQGTIYVNDYDRFNSEDLLNNMINDDVKTLCAPRSILMMFIEYLDNHENNIKGKLTSIASAGELLTEYDKKTVKDYFDAPVKEGYGMTEIALPLYEDELGNKVTSPLYNKVFIDKKGKEKTGEIIVFGRKIGLLIGYLDKKKKYMLYRKPPVSKGIIIWHTSDMAHDNDKGDIICDGRYGNVVKINDCLVNKTEVEQIIKMHPLVFDCIVESKNDEISGNTLTSFIELKETKDKVTDADIKSFVKTKLPDYCRPKDIVFKKLERTPGGKVIRNDVVEPPSKCLRLRFKL